MFDGGFFTVSLFITRGVPALAAETSVSVPSSVIGSLIAAIEGLKTQIVLLSEKAVTTTADAIFDVVWKKTFHWITFFESLDGYTKDGATLDAYQVLLATKAQAGARAYIQKSAAWQGLATFSERSYFRTSITMPKETTAAKQYVAYLTVGNPLGAGATEYYGFKINDGSLYGVASSLGAATEKQVLLASMTDAIYNLETRYVPGKDIQFFVNPSVVNQSPKGTLPAVTLSSGVNTMLFTASIETKNAVQKALQFSYFEYFQRRSILQ